MTSYRAGQWSPHLEGSQPHSGLWFKANADSGLANYFLKNRVFPDGPVAKTELPKQGARV